MELENLRLSQLLHQYLSDSLNGDGEHELFLLLGQMDDSAVSDIIVDLLENHKANWDEERGQKILELMHQKGVPQKEAILVQMQERTSWKNWIGKHKLKVASVVFLLLSSSLWFLLRKPKPVDAPQFVKKSTPIKLQDVGPGRNKAILTLSNGTNIFLDSAANGLLAKDGGSAIQKQSNGALEYNLEDSHADKVLFNTLSTPRGGQYKLQLPDGTDVWLNASSSIKYPTHFSGSERVVEITGEAYFEVTKNAQMPFIVKMSDAAIHVLGTHFNVNAYTDEAAIKTTLLEGMVKTTKGNQVITLTPGQQAIITVDGRMKKNPDADVDEAIAWKEGFFEFHQADIKTIMRQISRWYDVDIEYGADLPQQKFEGEISRSQNLDELLKILNLGNVPLKLKGKILVIGN